MYEDVSYEEILERMLERVSDSLDKREGSVIMTALAPIAMEIFLSYLELDRIIVESYADTQSRDYLILRAREKGIEINEASASHWTISSDTELEIGMRFSVDDFTFAIEEDLGDGEYQMICEQTGDGSNVLTGEVLTLQYVEGLSAVSLLELVIAGEEEEDTESLRERYFEAIKAQAFGGNVADYKEKALAIDGVGEVKVVPVWDGAGTVKVIITSAENTEPSDTLVDVVQDVFDPNSGDGMGLAPIGHTCTVSPATAVEIVFSATVSTSLSATQISESIALVLDDYFKSLTAKWSDSENIIVRINQIESRILEISGVSDITNSKINGDASNLELDFDEIPIRGAVNATVA
ncbi:MAG: baseplate J/gp47 family protein [Clostridia bacterium]